jgi:hypothetical protein
VTVFVRGRSSNSVLFTNLRPTFVGSARNDLSAFLLRNISTSGGRVIEFDMTNIDP